MQIFNPESFGDGVWYRNKVVCYQGRDIMDTDKDNLIFPYREIVSWKSGVFSVLVKDNNYSQKEGCYENKLCHC